MTSISASYSSSSTYLLSLDTNGDGVVSASEQAAGESETATRTQDPTVESSGMSGAIAQFASMLFNNTSTSQDDSDSDTSSASDMFAAMDTDADGVVSEDEFVAARPDDVTEDMASQLFSQIDTEGTGSITAEQYSDFSASMMPPPPPAMSAEDTDTDDDTSDVFSAMDTDGDGVVSEAEFIAARPDDVTEDMASQLFSQIDTEGTGSITAEQYGDFSASMMPPPPPAMSAEETETTEDSGATDLADVLASLDEIIAQYMASSSEQMAEDASSEIATV